MKTPSWIEKQGGYPTTEGWMRVKPNGRVEVLKSASFSAAQIAEWHAARSTPLNEVDVWEKEPVVQTLHEAPAAERFATEEEVDWHMEDDFDSHVD